MIANSFHHLTRATFVVAVLLLSCQLPTAAGHPVEGRRTRWEYCAIVSARGGTTPTQHYVGIVKIRYFADPEPREDLVRLEGEAIVTGTSVDSDVVEQMRLRALNTALAKLGRDGWELIGELPYARSLQPDQSETKALYFKRPLYDDAHVTATRPN